MSIQHPPEVYSPAHMAQLADAEADALSPGSSFTNLMSEAVSRHRGLSSPEFLDSYSQFPPRDRLISIHLPRRLFRWLYSFSLFIFAFFTFGFVAVTPIDVIAQTLGTSYSGIKLFIVIVVCVVFLVLTILLYFLRLFQRRVALNDIPTKSMYIPFENDLPRVVCERIDQRLNECMQIKEKGGPLGDEDSVINHPGRAPPAYIQERNQLLGEEGTYLPPNTEYEDVLRGFSDKIRSDGKTLTRTSVPEAFTFKELIVSFNRTLVAEKPDFKVYLPDFKLLVDLYEEMKFGGDLISEKVLLDFMILLDRLSFFSHGNLDSNRKLSRNRQYSTDGYDELIEQSFGKKSDFHYYNSDIFRTQTNSEDEDYAIYESDEDREKSPYLHLGLSHSESLMRRGRPTSSSPRHTLLRSQSSMAQSESSKKNLKPTHSPGKMIKHSQSQKKTFDLHSDYSSDANSVWDLAALQRYNTLNKSSSSTKSVIRNRLAISRPRASIDSFYSGTGHNSIRRPSQMEDDYEVRPYRAYAPEPDQETEQETEREP